MTVVALPNRMASQWAAAQEALVASLPVAGHPRLTEHAGMADQIRSEAGHPTRIWANRIAAIAVIAERRADASPTIGRRIAYLDVAAAATELLLLTEMMHDVRPDKKALVLLGQAYHPAGAVVSVGSARP